MTATITLIASAVSVLTFFIHTFVGGRFVASPLLEDRSLPRASKWLNYYCWHVTTVLIAFMAGGFLWLANNPHMPSLVFLGLLALTLSVLSAGVAKKAGIAPTRFPSTTLFAAISAVAILAWWVT